MKELWERKHASMMVVEFFVSQDKSEMKWSDESLVECV